MQKVTHFFLGANSGQGFQSLYDRFANSEDHYDLVLLKGGPGVGKSTLMATVGKTMADRGEEVELLHCSGDPDSLDGVHIPRLRTAILDATAPHVLDPKYPAAVDRVVNLGQFYDVGEAKKHREEIIIHTRNCSEAYQRAYRALGAARQLEGSARVLVEEALDEDKLLRRANGILTRELKGHGDGGKASYRFLGSLTCRGPVWRFDSAEALCSRVYELQDRYGLGYPLLEQIRLAAAARGFQMILCPDPEHPDRLHHLLLPELGVGFVTSKEGMAYDGPAYRRIRVDAMVSAAHYKRYKTRLAFLTKMARALRQEGMDALREAKSSHDALEAVYHPYVDFAGVEELTAQELRRIQAQ